MAAYGWITIDDSRGRRGNGAFVEVGQGREIPPRADVLYPQSSVWIFSVSARGSIDNSRDHSKSAGYTLKPGRKPAPSTMRLAAGEPGQDIHQLCDLRWRIEVHHHERLAPRPARVKMTMLL